MLSTTVVFIRDISANNRIGVKLMPLSANKPTTFGNCVRHGFNQLVMNSYKKTCSKQSWQEGHYAAKFRRIFIGSKH